MLPGVRADRRLALEAKPPIEWRTRLPNMSVVPDVLVASINQPGAASDVCGLGRNKIFFVFIKTLKR
jgi:hypothetical protein